MGKKIHIINGRVIDPSGGFDGYGDLLIEGGRIAEVIIRSAIRPAHTASERKVVSGEDSKVIDARGMLVLPGLVDMHTHLREPGFEHKETIKTGTMAGMMGGFTSLCPMPNTSPVNDDPSITSFVIRKAREEGYCSVFPVGAVTKGEQGQELADMELMRNAGCVGFSDDGRPVMNSLIMRKALEFSRSSGLPVISHCEDLFLSDGGVMNEGALSARLGLKGIPAEAEEVMVARDIMLARLTSGKLHIAHVSTRGSVELVRRAKGEGIAVTAETCPHYFSITEQAVERFNADAKVNPPLRTDDDVAAIKEGLRDGTIDVIATDHAPHHKDEKMLGLDRAPSGISGLETALALSLALVGEGVLTIGQLAEKMSFNPSRILGIDRGTLRAGAAADVVVIDAQKDFVVNPDDFASKGKNTPFRGMTLRGQPLVVITNGTVFDISGRKA